MALRKYYRCIETLSDNDLRSGLLRDIKSTDNLAAKTHSISSVKMIVLQRNQHQLPGEGPNVKKNDG